MIPTILKSYQRQDGRAAELYDAPLVPKGLYTASGTGDIYEMADLDTLDLKLDVLAVTGVNPTLDVIVEYSPDGVNDWQTFATFGRKTAVSYERNVFPGASTYVRASWVIGGTSTPSFRFELGGLAK